MRYAPLLGLLLVAAACKDDAPAPAQPEKPVPDARIADVAVPDAAPPDAAGPDGGDAGDAGEDWGDGGELAANLDIQIVAGEATFEIVPGEASFEVEEAPTKGKKKKKRRGRKARKGKDPKPAKVAAAEPKKPVKRRPRTALSTIRSHYGDIERCYGPVAMKDPSVKGKIVVQWTLGRDGRPTATAILKNTLKNKSVAQCIRTRARSWQFPPPNGGVAVITYPFNLSVQ